MPIKENPNLFLLCILALILGCLVVLQNNDDSLAEELRELKQKQANCTVVTIDRFESELKAAEKMQEMQKLLEHKLSDLALRFSQNEEHSLVKMEQLKRKVEELQQQLTEANRARARGRKKTVEVK